MSLDGVSFVLGLRVSLQSCDIFGGLAPLILSWMKAVGIVQANFRNIGVRKKVSTLPRLINVVILVQSLLKLILRKRPARVQHFSYSYFTSKQRFVAHLKPNIHTHCNIDGPSVPPGASIAVMSRFYIYYQHCHILLSSRKYITYLLTYLLTNSMVQSPS